MSSSLIEIFRYDLPLARPLHIQDQEVTRRTGLILKFGLDEPDLGYGEIAPLPGLSRETLDQALESAIRWSGLLGRLPKDPGEREQALAFLQDTPSVAFGIECATFGFRHSIGSPYALGLFSKSRRSVSVNALISGTLDNAVEQALAVRDRGFRAAKLKVGRQTPETDVETVWQVREALGDAVALRLDANRAWDLDAAVTFARGAQDCRIEYLEEPLASPEHLREFVRRTGVPVALDETLMEQGSFQGFLHDKDWVKAVVLKPTVLGGIGRCGQLAYDALEFGITPVVSSCFESGLGLIALARFASALTTEDIPAGLDTYDWLGEDVLSRRFTISNGSLDLDELDECAATLNTAALEQVYRE